MKHLRSDYDGVQDANGKIPDDEPVFLLRARDVTAARVVRYWAELAEHVGAEPEMVAAVRAWADEMIRYAGDHGGFKRPDVDPVFLQSLPQAGKTT